MKHKKICDCHFLYLGPKVFAKMKELSNGFIGFCNIYIYIYIYMYMYIYRYFFFILWVKYKGARYSLKD